MLSPARRVVVLLLAAAAAPEAAQAFVGAPVLPPTGRPGALHRHVYSLQMMSKPDERSLRTRVATKFAALVSALVVGAGAMPQASNAKTAVEQKAPATAISRMIPADVQAAVTKNSMAAAATVISAGGLTFVLAKNLKSSKKSSPAPAAANPAAATPAPAPVPAPAAAKPAPRVGGEDPLEMLLRTKKADIASAGPRKPGGTATKMGTRPSPVVTGTATIYIDDSQQKTTPTYDSANWKMGDRPEGYHTKTSSR